MLPCEEAGSENGADSVIKFDTTTGMMTHPLKEEWMVWKVQRGGAYLFFPGKMAEYLKETGEQVTIEEGGFVVSTPKWKRTIIEKKILDESGETTATVFDFIFKTKLETDNEEWFVRFTAPIANDGIFHTDLNGANFDTHHFRADLPIQSQVFPMPTLASIEDSSQRFTVLSEHAQGTASLQNGSIDVWLDRRLRRDDERGLGQGVRDNVLTRTRLRLLLETENYDGDPSTEFEITHLCKRMWDELNHPLEVFGTDKGEGKVPTNKGGEMSPDAVVEAAKALYQLDAEGGDNVVPFVYMVYKRVDDFKHAIDSLRNSDFPKESVPLIISHDGHVSEMVEYVETLKSEFNIIQIFHPHACYDHPKSFPGDAAELNEGYAGDTYGNPRSSWATCAKHHWTWMMKHVFDELEFDSTKLMVDEMFFMEEDYVVSPTIYETVTQGLYLANKNPNYFGVVLDITDGGVHREREGNDWQEIAFRTGPMAIGRKTWQKVVNAKDEFCNRDEYNWDWSVVWLANKGLIPYKVLAPFIPQVQHIGLDGMHVNNEKATTDAGRLDKARLQKAAANWHIPQPFHGSGIVHVGEARKPKPEKPNGGFGHPQDHEHCLKILGPTWLKGA